MAVVLPLHEEAAEARLNHILGRKDKDLQHIALFGHRVADHAWEDAVHRALRHLEIYDEHVEKTKDLELALYLTLQGEMFQVGHQFLHKMDMWVVMDEARRRIDGELPRGAPGKKKARYPGENEPKRIFHQYPAGTQTMRSVEVKDYYSNPAIPRGLDDE